MEMFAEFKEKELIEKSNQEFTIQNHEKTKINRLNIFV
jgi:hypothetical protein